MSKRGMGGTAGAGATSLRLWQRLGVRLAALFAVVTLLAVVLVGVVVHERQKRELEDGVGTQLLNIARIGALLIDSREHADAQARGADSAAYGRLAKVLSAIRTEAVLPTPIYTLALESGGRGARLVVTTDDTGSPGMRYEVAPQVAEPLAWTFQDGVARYTGIYRNPRGTWISAFAPVGGEPGKTMSVLVVDYPLEIYLDRLRELRLAIMEASGAGAVIASLVGLLVARRITRPVAALTQGVARVGEGDLAHELPVQSSDEVGVLTRAFNDMLEGLRQRDFIRDTFGRYVSPEVAKALLESPGALALGGEKRVVTILMSDLRGYTRFAERGDPAWVMEVLNGYLARMTEIVVAHAGTINEFIGDAIFVVFGAPIPHADHAERAAATALAMQRAMAEINAGHEARGLPRFEMGIGVNTGEAVVGNIGSEQRAKYAVVGSAVNVAGRIEGATVGGQIFISATTYEAIRDRAEVMAPIEVNLKGVAEPLTLYELRGLRGQFAQRLDDATAADDAQADVALPLTCRVIEGKTVGADVIEGTVVRLGRRGLAARLERGLAPLTNVSLRLRYPGAERDSGDLYGKVTGEEPVAGGPLTVIRLTSVDIPDQRAIDVLLAAEGGNEADGPLSAACQRIARGSGGVPGA